MEHGPVNCNRAILNRKSGNAPFVCERCGNHNCPFYDNASTPGDPYPLKPEFQNPLDRPMSYRSSLAQRLDAKSNVHRLTPGFVQEMGREAPPFGFVPSDCAYQEPDCKRCGEGPCIYKREPKELEQAAVASHVHVTYADHPKSVTEIRAAREDGSPSDWTPRDILINMLRDIDSGKIKAENLALVWQGSGEHGFSRAGPYTVVAIGLLTAYANQLSNWYHDNSRDVPPGPKSA